MRQASIALAGVALLAACTAGSRDDPTVSAVQTVPQASIGGGDGVNGKLDRSTIDALVDQAANDAGVEADEITVVSAQPVTWSDGSLGCPQEGGSYTQALVPGYRVVLDIGGDEVHYHAGTDGAFFPCDEPQEPIDDGRVDR